ncbi:MAG TPA: ribonuclease domain-containing protein [Lacipirellulaceae bacterium]
MIAFYVGLLLLVAWLKYSSSSDGVPQGQFPTSVPATAPDRERRSAEQDVARDDWTPKSRVLRNDAPAAENNERESPVAAPAHASERSESAPRQSDARDDGLLIHNVGVIDENHRVVYRGDVDLAPTLKRIESGRRLRFYHDGIVFENREHRLPAKPSGYYHEFVQPTPGDNGPGAQRVVLGAEDEVFYSSDHYRSFRRVR